MVVGLARSFYYYYIEDYIEGMGVYVIVVALGPNNNRGSRRYMSSSSYLSNNSDGINNIRGF